VRRRGAAVNPPKIELVNARPVAVADVPLVMFETPLSVRSSTTSRRGNLRPKSVKVVLWIKANKVTTIQVSARPFHKSRVFSVEKVSQIFAELGFACRGAPLKSSGTFIKASRRCMIWLGNLSANRKANGAGGRLARRSRL